MPDINDLQLSPAEQILMQSQGQNFNDAWGGQKAPPQGGATPQQQPAASPFDQYLQSVIEQTQNYSRDSIYADKVKEYYRDLGVKNPDSWQGKLAAHLSEIGKSVQANNNRPAGQRNTFNDYVGPTERLHQAADTEFEKQSPLLKAQLQELFRTGRNENTVGERAYAENVRADTARKKQESAERIQTRSQDINRLKALSQAGVQGATAALANERRAGLAQTREALQQHPLWNTYSPALRDAITLQQYNQDHGDDATADLFGKMNNEAISKAPPSENKFAANMTEDDWKNIYMPRKRELFQAHPLNSSGFQIIPGTGRDANNEVIPTAYRVDKKTGDMAELKFPEGGGPRNQAQQTLENDAKQTEANSQVAWSNVIRQIQEDKEGTDLGTRAGNPLSVWARKMGYTGPEAKGADEAEMQQFVSNTVFKHTRAMVNSGRLPVQVLGPIEGMISKQSNAPTSIANSLAAVVYSSKLIRAVNSGAVKPEELTPTVVSQFAEEERKALRSAMADKVLKKQNPNYVLRDLKLPEIRDIIDRVKQGTVPRAATAPMTPPTSADAIKNNIRSRLGLPNAQ